jgi:hypothetical protein
MSIPDWIAATKLASASPQSSGITTKDFVASAAVKNNSNQDDILSQDRAKAIQMLEGHLLWQKEASDNLMSWTSSFLFAMHRAIRRQATDRPLSPPRLIHIWVLDTRKASRGSFLPAVGLLKAYEK